MSRTPMPRALALALASSASLALLAPAALAVPATPAPTAANDPEAAAAAADYIADQVPADGNLGLGGSADAALALLAAGGHDAEVNLLVDYLETEADLWAGGGGPAAGKLAIVAAATGNDATSFGGVNLVSAIEGSIQEDGTCGGWGYAFGNALCILGLERAGAEVPDNLVENSLGYQDPATGAFGFFAGADFTAETDATGLMLAALAGIADEDREAALAAAAARDYLVATQVDAGYWENYSPVNATGLVAPALQTVGVPQGDAVAWLAGQQLGDGGLPNVVDGASSDLMATTQGILPFTGESYLSVGAGGTDAVELRVTPDSVERIAGADRYGTAAAASFDAFAPGVDTVFIATGTSFADALTGSALAGHLGAPILLVKPTSVPGVTASELARLKPSKVVVLGGTASVSEDVKTRVGSYAGGNVERLSGANRYATAAAVAGEFPEGDHVFVATGRQYADALAASAAAGADGVPVLLVTQDGVPSATATRLAALDPDSIIVLGGTGVVSAGVVDELGTYGSVTRVAGTDRYATAAALSAARGDADAAVLATGTAFPDALTGSAYAAMADAPVLLVRPTAVPSATWGELDRLAARTLLVFGGKASVADAVLEQLEVHNYAG